MTSPEKNVVEYERIQRNTNRGTWLVYTKEGSRLVFIDRDIVWYNDHTEEFETLTTAYVPS